MGHAETLKWTDRFKQENQEKEQMKVAVLPTWPSVVRTDRAQLDFLFLILEKILVTYNIYTQKSARKCTTEEHFKLPNDQNFGYHL